MLILLAGVVALLTDTAVPGPELRPVLGLEQSVGVEPCSVDPEQVREPDGDAGPPAWSPAGDIADPVDELFAVASGGRVYAGGGLAPSEDGTTLRSIDSFGVVDPSTGLVQALPALPVRLDHAAAAAHRGAVYVIGGFSDDAAQARMWRYSPMDERWSELPSMPTPRGAAGAAVADGRLYVVGGVAGSFATLGTPAEAALEVFDFASGTWSNGPRMPTARHHLGVTALGGKLYAVGGRGPGDLSLDAAERFDPVTNAWERLPRLPLGSGGLALAVRGGRVVALGGGDDDDGWVTPATWAFSAAGDDWTRLGDMGVARHGHRAVTLGRTVYALGGSPCVGWGRTGLIEALG